MPVEYYYTAGTTNTFTISTAETSYYGNNIVLQPPIYGNSSNVYPSPTYEEEEPDEPALWDEI